MAFNLRTIHWLDNHGSISTMLRLKKNKQFLSDIYKDTRKLSN